MKQLLYVTLFILFALVFDSCGDKTETLISGETMGTTYHIKVITGNLDNISNLKDKIDQRLGQINQSMSTWIKDSEISRFNDLKKTGEKIEISDDFVQVMIVAEYLYRLTAGAWDGTVNPLVNLWGFGTTGTTNTIPPPEVITRLVSDLGFNYIQIIENRYLAKKKGSISLDLASIAKGYAVDKIAELIEQKGIKNFLVEIGGEVYAAGTRVDGQPWKIGINTPRPDAPNDQVYKAITIRNKAFATSGDYRNFFEINGKRYSHIIDPRTGYPVDNSVVSVSVIADTCTFADGLATALMVMGPEKGLALVNRLDRVESLIIVRNPGEQLVDYYSKGFNDQ
ncbi:MAG: FAD:protein FMN transferase [Planctomycetota bacterium]|jgi:thiamine biosynthesis lipoprotein